MMHRKTFLGACAGALALASAVATAAISAPEERAPSGQVQRVEEPRSLPPQGPQSVSATQRPAPGPTGRAASAMADMGITNAKLAREVDDKQVFVGKMGSELICMSVGGGGRLTTTCQSPQPLSQGHLWLGVGGTAEKTERVYGIAPDGVSEVLLTDARGKNDRVDVRNNVFAAPRDTATARIEWQGANGAEADLRLPTRAYGSN